MTTKELLYVKTIAEEKSISQAAKKLFLAQPSLSQSLQRIEDGLGTRLFNRTAAGLTLTYAGERYYQTACRILKIYGDLEAEISDINDLRTGRISFGVTNHLGTILLPQFLPDFMRECPGIELSVYEGNTAGQEEHLLSGELDFSLLHAPKQNTHPLIRYEVLREDPFVVALAAGHPLTKKAQVREGYAYPVLDLKLLKHEPFLMLHREQRIRHVADAILAAAGIAPPVALTLKNYETAQGLAGAGAGVTLLPGDYARIARIGRPPALFSIDEQYGPSWDLCIATLKNAYLSRAAASLLSLARERIR